MNTSEPTPRTELTADEAAASENALSNSQGDSFFPTLSTLPPLSKSVHDSYLMHAYIAVALIANMMLMSLKGYGADLGYWQDWVRQLSTTGYDGFDGNYPPLYIHWLYVVGQFYNFSGIPLEHNHFLKFLTQIPVVFFHGILVSIIFFQLKKFNASRHVTHLTLALTALNPAILINGPIWGQVDLIPATILLGSLLLATGERYVVFAIPLFALALLTKFQMIAFAPLFGFLFFRNPGKHLIGILISIVLGALTFLPAIIADHFWASFRQAYIDTLGQYPLTTFNAANLWILLTENTIPDNVVLFGVNSGSIFGKIFTAKYFGMILFSVTALFLFVQGLYLVAKNRQQISGQHFRKHCLFAATICALAFFTLLPAMHERYLFPAVVMALGYFVFQPNRIIYPVGISLFCSLNMLIILEINGSDIWTGLAWLTLLLFVVGVLELCLGNRFVTFTRQATRLVYRVPALSVWVFVIGISAMTLHYIDRFKINHVELADNEEFLTKLPMDYARQDHGTIKINRSYDNNYLSLNKRRYAQGIGSHANSDVQFRLPDGAIEFRFIAGIDDEVGTADAQFSIWGDDKLLWQSPPYLGYETYKVQKVDVRGVKKLNLKVSSLKEDKWDHVDWVNTVITFERPAKRDESHNKQD